MTTVFVGILVIVLTVVVVSLLASPLEALRSGRVADLLGIDEEPSEGDVPLGPADEPPPVAAKMFAVFVSGIGSISGDALLPAEARFLDRLEAALPEARVVRDVFPYAPSGRPLLTGQRFFSWFWRRVSRWRASGDVLLPLVLNVRNLYQVLVSADRRYGPLYSRSIALVIADRLHAAGYRFASGVPVVLLGSSGGGQISAGAATYLGEITGAPVSLVTFGGVMSADPGLDRARRIVSLYGGKDGVYRLGRLAFPGRWSSSVYSSWNVAVSEARLREDQIGPFGHSGKGGYLDATPHAPADAPLETTLAAVTAALREVVAQGGGAPADPETAAP